MPVAAHAALQVASVRAPYQVLEGFLMKSSPPPFPLVVPPLTHRVRYTWSSAGLIMVALPSFYSKAASNEDDTTSGRTQNFVSTRCLCRFARVTCVSSFRPHLPAQVIARRLLLDASDAMERLMSACVTQHIHNILVCVLVWFGLCFVCETDTMHRFQKLTAIVFNHAITVLSH